MTSQRSHKPQTLINVNLTFFNTRSSFNTGNRIDECYHRRYNHPNRSQRGNSRFHRETTVQLHIAMQNWTATVRGATWPAGSRSQTGNRVGDCYPLRFIDVDCCQRGNRVVTTAFTEKLPFNRMSLSANAIYRCYVWGRKMTSRKQFTNRKSSRWVLPRTAHRLRLLSAW